MCSSDLLWLMFEDLEETAGFLVDETADMLDATTTGQTADHRLGDPLDVVPQNLAAPLCSSLTQTLFTFQTCSVALVFSLKKTSCSSFGWLIIVID